MKKFLKYFLILLMLLILFVGYTYYPALNIVTGYASKNMASGLFLAERDQLSIEKEDNGFLPINFASYKVNEDEKSVSSSIFGLMKRKAIYVDGLGAILVNDSYQEGNPFKIPNRFISPDTLAYPYGNMPQKDTVFGGVDYEKLQKAVNNAFDREGEQVQQTRSVLVIYKDQIIAEKYSDGFNQNSLMHGWSMTKSLTSAIYGILEKQDRMDIGEKTGLEAWANDERSEITYNDLLHMNSGLVWDEDYFNISDATKMLYLESDMGQVQLENQLVGEPDQLWNYSSGTTNILSGPLLRKEFDSHQEYLDFWYREFIDKIGMHSTVIETDLAGNYVGSSYAWATTRDWAKFGLLYLHEGNWNGEQVLDSSWVAYTSTPTNTSEGRYGAQFWLNAGSYHPDVPKDMYSCNGFKGQYVFIIPSQDLVVVRTGLSADPKFNINEFLVGVIESLE
ncbi:MAG: serine hydrolase [Flavobacteriales bacterium]|nr:serine hydrolase [Flavobacteriales bacterium]